MSDASAALKGAAFIKDEVRRLPDRPGVYRMVGEGGEVLYVGKARSLKKRVLQYAQGRFHTQRIALMVDLTRSMEFVTTRTETDALLLEINLIKQLKPRFNVLLRDDKSFPRDRNPPRAPGRSASQTPRGPHHQGRLFRTLRIGLFSQPHAQHLAEGLPAEVLPRTVSTRAAPAPACCTRSSAARRPAPGSLGWTTTAGWWTRPRPSFGVEVGR